MVIGLVMIVRDEEALISRALLSALPFISTWVIVDTGSTDRTKEIIETVFAAVPGLLVDRPWVSFEKNRSEALALCDGRMDWAIMLDADDTIEGLVPPASLWTNQEIDAFMLNIKHGTISHNRPQIFRTGLSWAYKGAVHEYAHCQSKEKPVLALLPNTTYMLTRCEGYRSRDPHKYHKDALLLEAADLTDSRTLFYLAQSYRDAGQRDLATARYRQYLDLSGGWIQERYLSLVNLISLIADSEQEEKYRLAWAAIELCPDRLEAPYAFLRQRRNLCLPMTHQCYAIASASANRKPGETDLFVVPDIYAWGMDNELAVAAFATKHYRESYDASLRCCVVAKASDQSICENALSNARLAFPFLSSHR